MVSREAWRLMTGYRGDQLIAAACKLELPDLLVGPPST